MRILYITTIGETMRFFKHFIRSLLNDGHTVDIATNENKGNTPVQQYYREWRCKVYHIDTSRSPFQSGNIRAIRQIREIAKDYDIVHCHTPIAAACTRLACKWLRKSQGLKVFYTAHGFHFYTEAPLKNWLIYYPIEKILAKYTDVLITINKDDYKRAKKHFKAGKVEYVPGVGVDTEKFTPREGGREKIRKELVLTDNQIMLLSVGELNENKNHSAVVRAIKGIPNITYVIAGEGDEQDHLKALAQETGVDVRLIGFRTDVANLYNAADIYILPSIREGLNVSLMEAMASGLPVACGRIRGNVDLITTPECLFDPSNIEDIASAVHYAVEHKKKLSQQNSTTIKDFNLRTVESLTSEIYIENHNSEKWK